MQSDFELHSAISEKISNITSGEVNGVTIIGSYLINNCPRNGSDIDLIVAVDNLENTELYKKDVIYKDNEIVDSMGRRKELNVNLGGYVLDLTYIDSFNTPNNPINDNYENAIGSALMGKTISGERMIDIFEISKKIDRYVDIRVDRLEVVSQKIEHAKDKLKTIDQVSLKSVYDLNRLVFIRECIGRKIFNHLGDKYADLIIPSFSELFREELEECGVEIKISKR